MYDELMEPMVRIDRDMLKVIREGKAGGVTDSEARFLVDLYYAMQKQRIHLSNKVKGLARDATKSGNEPEPHEALDFILNQSKMLEQNVAKTLDAYVFGHPMYWFFDQTLGIGPILSAGLLAHIDIEKAPTLGHIENFAGLNPKQAWCSREQAKAIWRDWFSGSYTEALTNIAHEIGRNPDRLIYMATTGADGEDIELTEASCIAAIARKPFNGQLKTLCWKIGESFVKTSGNPKSFYGQLYLKRKVLEWRKNISGNLTLAAEHKLQTTRIGTTTDAYMWYSGRINADLVKQYLKQDKPLKTDELVLQSSTGTPMLPPAHIHARAKRYAVKIFLSHLQTCWWRQHTGEEPPAPYVFVHGQKEHAHYIAPPQVPPAQG